MVRRLTYIILLVAGVLLVGSESEFYICNIIGLVMMYISGHKLKIIYENNCSNRKSLCLC